jgi:hypothetical protein
MWAQYRETPLAWKGRGRRAICWSVSSRAAVLAGLALAVLAAGVYLFIQVRETPARAHVSSLPHARAPEAVQNDPVDLPPPSPDTHTQVGRPLEHPAAISDVRPAQGPVIAATDDHPAISEVPDKADPRFMMVLGEANKAYDRQDFEEARSIAQKVLAKDPANTRMLRIMVSSHCIEGDQNAAQQWYEKLPEFDRQQMTKRCSQYGITFKEPGQ